MKITNVGKQPFGLFTEKGKHVVIHPGETHDEDFVTENKGVQHLFNAGHLVKGTPKEKKADTPDLGFIAAHHSFGDWTVKDKNGNRVNGADGEPLLFKKADGDAKAAAEAAAAKFNTPDVA